MKAAQYIAAAVIVIYFLAIILLYIFQSRIIFHPGKLSKDFKFKLSPDDDEVFLKTSDGMRINGLYFDGTRHAVILYFHGNAGDLSGWRFAAEDFTALGYPVLMIDYRGYGKSEGHFSEDGFYRDAEAAYAYLTNIKGFATQDIIVYGRSVGTGVAVELASKHKVNGLVLESPYTSFGQLANEKLPFFFPSLYLDYKFNNVEKIGSVTCPVILIHGERDSLIPPSHSKRLQSKIKSKSKLILVPQGSHNDLNSFPEYQSFLQKDLGEFFSVLKISN
jgi:fermentation-respiration switch protein FrsA (DUF1100 family)